VISEDSRVRVIHHTTKAYKSAKKQADKNAKNLKTIAEKRHRRNRKNVKGAEKIFEKQPLESSNPRTLFSN